MPKDHFSQLCARQAFCFRVPQEGVFHFTYKCSPQERLEGFSPVQLTASCAFAGL